MSKPAQTSVTVKNIEAAFAGESMAHIKYLYFARVCRAQGDEESARIFEETAAQEVQHASAIWIYSIPGTPSIR